MTNTLRDYIIQQKLSGGLLNLHPETKATQVLQETALRFVKENELVLGGTFSAIAALQDPDVGTTGGAFIDGEAILGKWSATILQNQANQSGNIILTLPTNTGTLALTTDLPAISVTNGILNGSYNSGAISFAPYASKQSTLQHFYLGATNPTITTRLNFDGYLYATRLYSAGQQVLTSSTGIEVDPVFTAHTVYSIANGTGFLKNNGSGTWTYDNNTYLTTTTAGNTYVPLTRTVAGVNLVDNITATELTAAINVATQSLKGVMSAEDKINLDTLVALLATNDGDTVVNTIAEVLSIFANYPEGADFVTALAGKQPIDADLTSIAALTGTTGLLRKTAANVWSLDTRAFITGNQSITLSGDISGTGTTSISTTIGAGKVINTMLANSTISGIALGGSLNNLTISSGLSGTVSTYNGSAAVTISHADTSAQASINNSNGNVIQDVTLDTYGHVTGLASTNLDDRYYQESEISVFDVGATSPVTVSISSKKATLSLASAYGDTLNPYASKTANYILAAPNGSAGVPSFRAFVNNDLPNSGITAGTYTAVQVNSKGIATAGAYSIEVGSSTQTAPSAELIIGGLFFLDKSALA